MPRQPYHLTPPSPWPLVAALVGWAATTALVSSFWGVSFTQYFLPLAFLIIAFEWWRDVTREATMQGHHSALVTRGLKIGIVTFISSEVMFFFGFFWAFFHGSLSPAVDLGIWPPHGVEAVNPFSVPLLNTLVLLSSGATITYSHHWLVRGVAQLTRGYLQLTVLLGLYFTLLQLQEYQASSFTMADAYYGSIFFVATGFHGVHVLIGTLGLIATNCRLVFSQFSNYHHFGFEATAWYWHFVDVVWIFLYTFVYCWGA